MMERAEWLKQMREKSEKLYDLYAKQSRVETEQHPEEFFLEWLRKFLARIPLHSRLLSASCGEGRYDEVLLEAGHKVVGIDQSAETLIRAREYHPEVQYMKIGLQEMDFVESFDGMTCIDSIDHNCPEDWPGILQNFHNALKPGGVLYFSADVGWDRLEEVYERAKRQGLPVVFGEVADQVEEAYGRAVASGGKAKAEYEMVYHYLPSPEQVKEWLSQTEFVIEEYEMKKGYGDIIVGHFLVRKR